MMTKKRFAKEILILMRQMTALFLAERFVLEEAFPVKVPIMRL